MARHCEGCEMPREQDREIVYRNRAEELRAIADLTKDPQIRTDLKNWAEECERVANALAALKAPINRDQISN